ncbi:hypothetical protein M885DRAFT_512508 [Pelagophyceae sp. CCMP2097]|nr:hypothetical protein M885DRAFT_512508 [Pelagophyceae sp. CCMP2097]
MAPRYPGRWSPGARAAAAGAPMVIFMIGASFVLSTFTQGTVERRDFRYKSQTETAFNIEKEHDIIMSKLQTDDYESKPIERPDG